MSLDFGGILRAGLNKPLEPINGFINKINDRLSSPVRNWNKRLLSMTNPYSKRNVLELMNSVADPVNALDWVAAFNGPPGAHIDPIYIQSVRTPNESLGSYEQLINGVTHRTAGRYNCSGLQVSLFNDSDAIAFTWARMWFGSIKRFDRFYPLSTTYQRDLTVWILDPTQATVYDLTFSNCWLDSTGDFDLNQESNLLPINLSLQCDEVLVSADSDLSSVAFRLGSIIPNIPTVRGMSSY